MICLMNLVTADSEKGYKRD